MEPSRLPSVPCWLPDWRDWEPAPWVGELRWPSDWASAGVVLPAAAALSRPLWPWEALLWLLLEEALADELDDELELLDEGSDGMGLELDDELLDGIEGIGLLWELGELGDGILADGGDDEELGGLELEGIDGMLVEEELWLVDSQPNRANATALTSTSLNFGPLFRATCLTALLTSCSRIISSCPYQAVNIKVCTFCALGCFCDHLAAYSIFLTPIGVLSRLSIPLLPARLASGYSLITSPEPLNCSLTVFPTGRASDFT